MKNVLAAVLLALLFSCVAITPQALYPSDPAGLERTRLWSWPLGSYPIPVYQAPWSDECTTKALHEAVLFWEERTGRDLLVETASGPLASGIQVTRFLLPQGSAGRTVTDPDADMVIDHAEVFISNCQTATAVHELGHALGLGHSPDPANVMYWRLRPGNWGTSQDQIDALMFPWETPADERQQAEAPR